jgi:hypothetical protein
MARNMMTTAEMQDRRTARAIRNAGEYTFTAYNRGEWIVEGPRGAYLVREAGGCSCEDHLYRAGEGDFLCKHAVMLNHHLIELGVLPEPPAPRVPTVSEKMSADLGRVVVWTERDEKAFDKIFA